MLAAMAMGFLIGDIGIKHIVTRPRPFVVNPDVKLLIKAPSGYSLTPREYEVVLSTSVNTDWNEDHTRLITVTVYDISIDDKASVTVVNEPVVTPPPTSTPTPRTWSSFAATTIVAWSPSGVCPSNW